MKIVMNDVSCGHFLAKIAGTTYNEKIDVNFCNIVGNGVAGGVIFNGYTHWSIQIHSAALTRHWINRDMLFATFDYPFNQLQVKRIFGQVPETNHHALNFNHKIGFTTVARIAGVYPGDVACVVMRMDREDCRYLNIKPRTIKSNIAVEHEATVH